MSAIFRRLQRTVVPTGLSNQRQRGPIEIAERDVSKDREGMRELTWEAVASAQKSKGRQAGSVNVVLVGGEAAGAKALDALHRLGHSPVLVLVAAQESSGAALHRSANRLGIDARPAHLVRDKQFATTLSELSIDLLLNVHSLAIIAPEVLERPTIGSLNLHPGPLPSYAGLNVVPHAIANGENDHAVTMHWMDPGIDTGKIAYEKRFPILDTDTGFSVFRKCVDHGTALVAELFEDLTSSPEAVPRSPQLGTRRYFAAGSQPLDGRIDVTWAATRIHNLCRATDFGPFPSPCGYPRVLIDDKPVEVVTTRLTRQPATEPPGAVQHRIDGSTWLATGDDWLEVQKLRVDDQACTAEMLASVSSVKSFPQQTR